MSGFDSLKEAAKEKARQKGHNILNKLFGSDEKPELPPKPQSLSKPSKNDGTHTDEGIIAALNGLHISNQSSKPSSSFVGGFHPGIPPGNAGLAIPQKNSSHAASAPNLSKPGPIAMPTPFTDYQQSLTMQMALMSDESISTATFNRPHSNPQVPTTSGKLSASPPPKRTSSRPGPTPTASPTRPIKGRKKSDSSDSVSVVSISSSSPKPGQEQCSGVTKAGKRCNRMVKIRPSFLHLMSDNDSEESIHLYCFQHTKEVLTSSGFYSHENREFVEFKDWIPSHLQLETQAALRVEMEKPRSKSDVYGYIYCYEIRDDNTETVKLKVGRTVNLVKRIDQWGKQCGSKEPILRGRYPPDNNGEATSLMKGVVKAGEKSKWCHRLERLIHIELSDLVSSAIYLDSAWPNIDVASEAESATSISSTGRTTSTSKVSSTKDANLRRCPDCGSVHKEIFEFQRWKKGANKGREWDNLVKPVIERWGKFVEIYL